MTEITSRLSTALADRYKIERHLGEGGMATVYLAEDLKHKRKVAVKVLRPELAAVLGAERFVQEITTTANLQHPHILPLFDSGEADSFLYYVMPFVEGETLRDKLNRETQLGIEEAVRITTDVADALDYAHQQGVIHRDIKPENILLHNGRPMVADFGIALAVSAAAGGRMTETGLSLGTPHYMSPEQATAEKDLTARSDIYSLGCVLYEMLTGEPPHTGASAQAVVMKIVTDEARPVTELRKSVPPNVAGAVAKALEKLAADRFTSAAQFSEALTNPAFAIPTAPAAVLAALPPSAAWNKLTLTLAGSTAVVALLATWGWLRPEPPGPVIRYSMALREEESLADRFGGNLTLSPDGSRLVYVGFGDNTSQLWLRERDQLRARELPGTEGATDPFFSPDGQRVGFFTLNPIAIKAVSLGGEPPIMLVDSGISRRGGAWGPDGYLYVGTPRGLVRVAASGGALESVSTLDTALGETGHYFPEVLPNGRGVLVTVWHGSNVEVHDIAVIDLETGRHEVLVRGTYAKYAPTGHLVFAREDGALLAAPFDQDKLALTGPATPLLDGVRLRIFGDVDLALSQTGTLAYVAGDPEAGSSMVFWVDRNGGATALDREWTFNYTGNGGIALSPDGTRLAVRVQEETADIWIKQLDRGPLSRLTFEGPRNFRPRWTPDGRSVTFLSNRSGPSYDLYQKRADGSGSAELLLDWEQRITEAFWSRDGQWLVLRAGGVGGTTGERDIRAIRPGVDSVPVELLTTPFDEKVAALSPDGRWLAYESNESGQNEVFVRPFPNAGDGKWQISSTGGTAPLWAHSGKELFYLNGSAELVAVDVVTTPTFSSGEQRVLFSAVQYFRGANAHHYDVTPDDQRFVMVGSARAGGGDVDRELIVVENFLEELKAKVGN